VRVGACICTSFQFCLEWYMNMRLLAGLLFAVSVVGFSLGASLPLVSLRLHEAGAGTLEIGIISAIPAAG
jgi:hypothetical protein